MENPARAESSRNSTPQSQPSGQTARALDFVMTSARTVPKQRRG
jgi:hypothetical protein